MEKLKILYLVDKIKMIENLAEEVHLIKTLYSIGASYDLKEDDILYNKKLAKKIAADHYLWKVILMD